MPDATTCCLPSSVGMLTAHSLTEVGWGATDQDLVGLKNCMVENEFVDTKSVTILQKSSG